MKSLIKAALALALLASPMAARAEVDSIARGLAALALGKIGLPTKTPAFVASAYATIPADIGKVLSAAQGAAPATITLMSAAVAGDGAVQYVAHNDPGLTITGAANNGAGLIRLTVASTAGLTTGETRVVSGVAGTVEANGPAQITVVDATHVDLVNSAFAVAYVSGGAISAGPLTVSDGSASLAVLGSYGDVVALRSNGSTWTVVGWNIQPQWLVRADPGGPYTITMPPLYSGAHVEVVSGGGQGGSGRQGATNTARSGGTGGNPGVYNDGYLPAAELGATPTMTVGAGGSGANEQAGADLDGAVGANGGASNFGSLSASGGTGGKAGTNAAVTSPSSQANVSKYATPGVGGATSVTAAGGAGSLNGAGPGAGGAGASFTSGNTELGAGAGSLGGRIFATNGQGVAGAAATTGGGAAGTAGGNKGFSRGLGGGGGGGATHGASAGGFGGAGGSPGGGGGGGAASLDGAASGRGGAGGGGEVRVRILFD